jgi:hypothetical protein
MSEKYRYLPCTTTSCERKVFRPNSERLVDAVAELNRLHQRIAEQDVQLEQQATYIAAQDASIAEMEQLYRNKVGAEA